MKITVKDEVVREIELPQYFKSGNRYYYLTDSYFIRVNCFAPSEENILLGLFASISMYAKEYLTYDAVQDFEEISATEFKIMYLKQSNTIEKML